MNDVAFLSLTSIFLVSLTSLIGVFTISNDAFLKKIVLLLISIASVFLSFSWAYIYNEPRA